MKKINDKKAISDMVSYILLIVIAMSLAVGVYSFMKFYIPKDKEKCSEDISLSIEDYNCNIAEGPKTLVLKIKNKGLFNITGFFIKAGNNTDGLPTVLLKNTDRPTEEIIPGRYDFPIPLKSGIITTANFDFTEDIDSVKRLRIQPFVYNLKGDNILLCERIADITLEGC